MIADTLTVDDADEAYAELTRRGLTPVTIVPHTGRSAAGNPLRKLLARKQAGPGNPLHAKRSELPFFTSQLAIMLETGTPLAAALESLAEQMTCPHWQALISQLSRQVEEGSSLAHAAGAYSHVFDPVFIAMISAGEASGTLAQILTRLANLTRRSSRLRHKVIAALIYPAMLTGIAISVICLMIFFVLPRFATVFTEMNVQLPASTRILLAISNFVRVHPIIFGLVLAAVITALVLFIRSESGKAWRARISLRLPIMGPLLIATINARIYRMIALLTEASVPLLDALELTRTATRNPAYTSLLAQTHESVLNGRTMYEILSASRLIPPSQARMIHTGEQNAQIGKVTGMLADYLDDINETKVGMLTSIMEPILLIGMGLLIGSVAVSLVLPMFDLSRIAG